MIHLQSNQRLYISEDLRGYVDKLTDDGTIPYAVDFLQLGFAESISERLKPATQYTRHEITDNTSILGNAKVVLEAVSQWYSREIGYEDIDTSEKLINFICSIAISGGRSLRNKWSKRSKSQIKSDIISDI